MQPRPSLHPSDHRTSDIAPVNRMGSRSTEAAHTISQESRGTEGTAYSHALCTGMAHSEHMLSHLPGERRARYPDVFPVFKYGEERVLKTGGDPAGGNLV